MNSKCTFNYNNKEYSREGLLSKLAQDLSRFSSKSIDFLKNKLGMSESEIIIVQGMIDKRSLGRFKKDGTILLSTFADDDTVYHEAFHRVYRMYITPKERERIQKQFRKRADWQSKIEPLQAKYVGRTDNELIEEYLADEFADYILNDGNIKIDPLVRSIFDRIIDFIKKLLGVSNRTIYDLYADIHSGKFSGQPLPSDLQYRSDADKIIINEHEYTAEVKNEFVQSVARDFLNKIFNSGTVYDLINGKFVGDFNEIYKESLISLTSAIIDENPQLADDILEDLTKGEDSYISQQFKMYIKTLGGNFEIKNYIDQAQEDATLEDGDANTELGRQQDDSNPQWVASFQVDPRTSMSKAIKFLLATLEDTSKFNSLGLYPQVRWAKAFNRIAQHMAGIPTKDMMIHLTKLNEPWVDQLITRLGGSNPDVNTLSHEQFRLRNEFMTTFAKTMNTYAIMSVEDNNVKWFDANQNTKDKKKLQEWNNAMVRSINDTGGFDNWLNRIQNELIDAKNPSEESFVELLGIDIEDELKNEAIVGADTFMTVMKKIATIIGENTKKKNMNNNNLPDYNNLFGEKGFDIKGTLEQVALVQGEYDQVVDLMVNSRGKRLYGISLNTHSTTTINTLNYISSLIDPEWSIEQKLEVIEQYLPDVLNYQTIEKTDTGYKVKSKWLDAILRGDRIDVIIVDGIKTQSGDEAAISDVDEADLLATTLNMSVSGINLSIKHSDRSVYYGYRLSGNPIFDYQQIGAATSEQVLDYLTLIMQDQLATEVRRANLENVPMIQYFIKEYKNSQLFDLKNIENLNPYSDDIRKMIRTKLTDELEAYNVVLDKWDVKTKGVSNEFLTRHNGSIDLLVASSFANQLLTHIEEMKVFLSDFTFFKNADDFYKRMSTTSGTGELLINDELTNTYIANMNDFSFAITNPKTGGESIMRYDKQVDGKFTVLTHYEKSDYESPLAIVEDKVSPIDGRPISQALFLFEKNMILDGVEPSIAKELAEAYASNYKQVNENDGQSWMNMFFFREYMMRLGQWSREMENLFLAEIKILNAKLYTDIRDITIEIDGEQVKVFDWSNWKNGMFEPVHTLKSQYAGFNQSYIEYKNKLNGEVIEMQNRIRPYTIYKTSFHVLWPSTIHGTNLAQMHHFMLTKKLDAIVMASANKSGGIDVQQVFKQQYDKLNNDQQKVADHGFNFYDQHGHFNDFVFVGDLGAELLEHSISVANIDSLKDQVRIGNHEKDEIRGSTQSLKILLSNLIVNGQPRFEGAQELVDEYRTIIARLVDKNVNALKEEFGYDRGVISKLDELVKAIKVSAEARSSPTNIIEAIEGFLNDPFIETLPNKTKMENIFYSIITNNAIVFNRPGNSYPQVAATGFEPIGSRTINNSSTMKISTQSDLKFYSIETDEEGNITKVNPAEIIIPIPQAWIPSILKRYKTNNIVEAVNQLNDDIARGTVDTEVTFKGLRIPNQQLSSNDIVKVKKFALPTNNNFVVVPSELVTKVGADFDLDKLNIYWNGQSPFFNIKEDSDFNALLDVEKRILLHPRNAHMLFMPVIDDLLKQDARKEIIGRLKRLPLKDTTTFFQSLTPHKNVEKGLTFVKSKFGVGIVALDITGHAVFMTDNININETYNNPNNDFKATPTKLLFEGMEDNYSLTSMYDQSGRIISEVQSQTMNSQVDAGKDPYAVGLGINNQTLNMFMYLNRRGVPAIIALKFINQPFIQQYLEAQRNNESFINKQRGDELRKDELIGQLYTVNGIGRPVGARNVVITERDLDKGVLNGGIDFKQAQYLEYFLHLVDEVGAFNDIKSSMTVDTKGKKDKAAVENFEKIQEKVFTTGLISSKSFHQLRQVGLLAPFFNAQHLYRQFFGGMYAIDQSSFGIPLKNFRDMMEQRQKGQYLKDRVRTTIENDFIVFLIQNFNEDFSLSKFNQIFGFTNEDSIAKQIQTLQANPRLKDNPVLQAFFPLLSVAKDKNENKLFDVVRLFERELTTIDINDFVDAMKDIRDEVSEDLYKSIIQLGIYQAGFMNSPFSLNKIIPTFDTTKRENGNLVEFTNDYLRTIQITTIYNLPIIDKSSETLFESFVNLFYLNNPQFLPKRFWKKSPIPYFNVWSKDRQERVLRYIKGNTNVEIQPLGNTYFKRYFLELVPTVDLTSILRENTKTSGITIISGGQYGADLGALQAGRELGFTTGGLAPKGYKVDKLDKRAINESNPDLANYGVKESNLSDYPSRTMANVDSSDGTIAFLWGDSVGTSKTIGYAQTGTWKHKNDDFTKKSIKPYLIITTHDVNEAATQIKEFVENNNIQILNVAGHRETSQKGIEEFVKQSLIKGLQNININQKSQSQQTDLFSGLVEPEQAKEINQQQTKIDGSMYEEILSNFEKYFPDYTHYNDEQRIVVANLVQEGKIQLSCSI